LKTADSAHAVLLQPPDDKHGRPPHEYKDASEERAVDESVLKDIVETLTTPTLHRGIVGVTSCLPIYGVRISFFRADDRIDLYFCFTCDDLAVYLNDKPVGHMKFIFACKRLLSDVLQIFPENEELKSRMRHCLR